MTPPPVPDLTLDEMRAALAPIIPHHAAFDGWSEAALAAAAAEAGLPESVARLAFASGPVAMIEAWFAEVDNAAEKALATQPLSAMRIRDRIAAVVMARIEAVAPDREALRRALAILALPTNAATATRLGWRAADGMWRQAGDSATDFSHYTKRATLAAVYTATILAFLDDESEGLADTRAFLDRRIGNVMRFEKLKARLRPDADRTFSPARLLGRLRYRAG